MTDRIPISPGQLTLPGLVPIRKRCAPKPSPAPVVVAPVVALVTLIAPPLAVGLYFGRAAVIGYTEKDEIALVVVGAADVVQSIAVGRGIGRHPPDAIRTIGLGWLRNGIAADLSDLTRPASRDRWLRWLGSALGWPESEHCPDFRWVSPFRDVPPQSGADRPAGWHIGLPGVGHIRFGAAPFGDWYHVPDLDVSSPEAWPSALRAVILAVGGGK